MNRASLSLESYAGPLDLVLDEGSAAAGPRKRGTFPAMAIRPGRLS